MTSREGTARRAAWAVFLLFAAVLLVVAPAEASLPRSAGVTQVDAVALASLERPALGLASPTLEPSGFSLGEDLSVFDTTNGQGSLGLCGLETSGCALTYARNNPLKYVDPDGKNAGLALGLVARKIAQNALIGAAAGVAVRLGFNMYIRAGNPNFDVKTGLAGAALNGATVGATGAKSLLGKMAANAVGSAAGTVLNGINAGHSGEQLGKDALNGAMVGLVSGVGDALFSAGLGQISSNVPSAAGAEAVDTALSAGISVTASTIQENGTDVLSLIDLIAGAPNPAGCAPESPGCSPVRTIEQPPVRDTQQ